MSKDYVVECERIKYPNSYTEFQIRYRVRRNHNTTIYSELRKCKRKLENCVNEITVDDCSENKSKSVKNVMNELVNQISTLCSNISPTRDLLTIPELPTDENDSTEKHFEMKFIKGTSLSNMWLSYVNDANFIALMKSIQTKFDNNELQRFIFYPECGEHVYFIQEKKVYRGIVQDYVLPNNKEDDTLNVKVLNIDNSDVLVLPQSSFYQLDDEGISMPMQCILCTVEDNINSEDKHQSQNVTFSFVKKHKVLVKFNNRKLPMPNSNIQAQSISFAHQKDQNGFNVNSKEFIPRKNNGSSNNIIEGTIGDPSTVDETITKVVANGLDSKSDQSTRSSSPTNNSSQGSESSKEGKSLVPQVSEFPIKRVKDAKEAHTCDDKQHSITDEAVSTSNSSVPKGKTNESKESTTSPIETKGNHSFNHHYNHHHHHSNYNNNYLGSKHYSANRSYDRDRLPVREYNHHRYNSGGNRYSDQRLSSRSATSAAVEKLKHPPRISSPSSNGGSNSNLNINEQRNRSISVPATAVSSAVVHHQSSIHNHPQSASILPSNTTTVAPYLIQAIPQFQSGSLHYTSTPGQFLPLHPPQQLNPGTPAATATSVPFPYSYQPAYLPSATTQSTPHPQYHVPPTSTHYPHYMQHVTVSPYYHHHQHISQQYYQASPLQPPAWSAYVNAASTQQPTIPVHNNSSNNSNNSNNATTTNNNNNNSSNTNNNVTTSTNATVNKNTVPPKSEFNSSTGNNLNK